jgi:hypothetical protein
VDVGLSELQLIVQTGFSKALKLRTFMARVPSQPEKPVISKTIGTWSYNLARISHDRGKDLCGGI